MPHNAGAAAVDTLRSAQEAEPAVYPSQKLLLKAQIVFLQAGWHMDEVDSLSFQQDSMWTV